MDKFLIYIKPTCSTCRKAVAILEELKVDCEKIDYFAHPLSKEKWATILKKMDIQPSELLRTKEEAYSKLGLGHRVLTTELILDVIVDHPELIQRPIVEYKDKAILGRPPEKIREFVLSFRS
ncbi:ArsC/Spx/MgsR family protein [Methylacidiphilum caldifontis]|uniref:Glutaredoxin n=1 Tax=Methylacidiphilum caldifontis TaxID=2795386 RepID=A0A4Y8PJ78_9BACT|nr:ArsC/Spx/MgsR family protein [Methylacidiphilum caldifontis]TFE71548.1 glutaredoxin [Methylacidiphilum caldifontis]